MTCEVSKSARIELALTNSGPNLEKKSGEQLKQIEAERPLVTANDERYALEKVALLIGNQKYESHEINKLVSPENDIRELCKLLEAPPLNFKVISLVNLKYGEMMNALDEFYQMLAVPGVYALFYYSGHGFNYLGSSNYLVPVDATLPLKCENNIESNAIGLGMQNKLSRAVVVLDCCKISKDDIPRPQGSLTSLTSYANHIEISSWYIAHSSKCVFMYACILCKVGMVTNQGSGEVALSMPPSITSVSLYWKSIRLTIHWATFGDGK